MSDKVKWVEEDADPLSDIKDLQERIWESIGISDIPKFSIPSTAHEELGLFYKMWKEATEKSDARDRSPGGDSQ